MKIKKIWFNEMPKQLEGYAVIIDAYAASANMAILLSKSPKRLLIVNEDNLGKARQTYKNTILIGESDILPNNSFVFTNRLKDMYEGNVVGKNILWMSINGSRVFEKVVAFIAKGDVIAGSLHNSKAVVDYLLAKNAKIVYLVMAGERGLHVEEDKICADLIEKRLLKKSFNWIRAKKRISRYVSSLYTPHIYENLPFLLEHLDEFTLVPKCVKNNKGFLEVRPF